MRRLTGQKGWLRKFPIVSPEREGGGGGASTQHTSSTGQGEGPVEHLLGTPYICPSIPGSDAMIKHSSRIGSP